MIRSHAREVFAYRRPPARRWPVAVKASLATALPLLAAGLAGHLTLGFLASLGGFTVLYGPTTPWRYRAQLMGMVAAGLVACVVLGTLTAGHPVPAVVAMTGVAAVAALVCNALLVGPPGAYFFVLVAGVAGTAAAHGLPAREVVLAAALGAIGAFVVGMSDLLLDRHGPDRRAVEAAERAVTGYEQVDLEQVGSEQAATARAAIARAAAADALHAAWTAVRDGGSQGQLVARAQVVQERFVAVTARATGTQLGLTPHPWGEVGEPDDVAGEHWGGEQVRDSSLGRPRPGQLLRQAVSWPGEKPLLAVRSALATALAGAVGVVIGSEHTYWLCATAFLVLHQGGPRSAQTHRGLQRAVGTLGGIVLFEALRSVLDEPWQAAVLVVVLQFVVELLVVRSYAAAVVVITPLALTIAATGHSSGARSLVVDRALDTVLGVVVALVVLWASGWGTAVPILRAQARRVVAAVDAVLADLAEARTSTTRVLEHRRMLYLALLDSDGVARRALADEPTRVAPYGRMERAVTELGYLVLGLCWHPGEGPTREALAAAREPLHRIQADPVTRHRPADDIAADVEAVTARLGAARAAADDPRRDGV